MKKNWALFIVLLVLIGAGLSIWLLSENEKPKEVNVLCWVGYDEAEIVADFMLDTGIRMKTTTFIGGDQMFTKLSQSKGEYDVVVMDPEYISKLHKIGKLQQLNKSDYDFNDTFQFFADFPLATINGELYGVVVRFGSCGLIYNHEKISAEEASSYEVLFNPKYKGKIGIWDWYLPSMGCMSRSVGNEMPYDVNEAQFARIQEQLNRLRPQVGAFYPSPAEMTNALANRDTWIVPAVGEWISIGLRRDGLPISFSIPKEGGVMWVETLGIPVDAPNREHAVKLIQWLQKPKAQAKMTQRKAYQSYAVNRKAYDELSSREKELLGVRNELNANSIISRLSVRSLPVQQTDDAWMKTWQRFKSQ